VMDVGCSSEFRMQNADAVHNEALAVSEFCILHRALRGVEF
jgi:hypothetical protein